MAYLSDEEGEFLVKLARRAVTEYARSKKVIGVPSEAPQKLHEKRGVFVTIRGYPSNELRGCIGFPEPAFPLVDATIKAALSSAFEDPRFPPLRGSELENVVFEVSVLTLPQLIKASNPQEYPLHIKVGRDGLIIEKGPFRGLLLPQVAVEYGWNEEEFLSQCCMKALVHPDAWLDRDTRVYKFQAEVFEEEGPKGSVKRRTLG
ncbi:MAG: TIGR00296 family protein [Candidatus Nezhaarchaeota archaeon]|nr:TIGR00296 family protein [Candidatus Nezhaarchaeota archaeon]